MRLNANTSGESFTQTWVWNDLGQVTSLGYPQCTYAPCTVPSPRTVSFGYTEGRLTSVPGYTGTITYHPNGMTAAVPHANGVTVNQANDDWSRPRPKSIATSGALTPAGAAQEWTTGAYLYDGSGNVIHQGSNRYVYDNLSRLKSANLTTSINGGAVADKAQSYVFDAVGNLTSTTTNGVTVGSPASSSTNRLTGSAIYDAAGNLTYWNGNTYEYDRLGMMWRMKAGSIEDLYIYTADDERLWVFPVSGTYSTWYVRDLSGKVLREYRNTGGTWSVQRDYVYRDGQLLAAHTPALQHFHLDHLGTPRLVTDVNRRRVTYHAYYPFGQEATSPTQSMERMKFTGHERDLNATSGTNPTADDLDYMHARFYNPVLGRFLSVDPVMQMQKAVRQPQLWNRYNYALNNPLKYVDPTGETPGVPTGDKGNCAGVFSCLQTWINDWLNLKFPPSTMDLDDPNVKALLEEYGEAREHPQNTAGSVQAGINQATSDIAAGAATAVVIVAGEAAGGAVVGKLTGIFARPSLLRGLAPTTTNIVQAAKQAGWKVGPMRHGRHRGQGLVLREVVNGRETGRNILWHPGGGHHGPQPYWKVSSGEGGTVRIGPQFD